MTARDDLALADALLKAGEIDEAEALVEKTEKALKAAQAAAEDDEEEGSDGDDEGQDDDEDEGDDDGGGDGMSKLGPRKSPPRYPGDPSHQGLSYPRDDLTDAMNEHRQVEHPQVTRHATQNPMGGRTRFDDRVDHIARRDGVPKTVAMQRARKEYGADFISSQRRPISATKRATYEDVVATEISKGCSRVVAEQRAQETYGATLPRSDFAKDVDTVTTRFMKRCAEIQQRDGCGLTIAMRKARQENEAEFEMFQLV